MEFDRYGFAVYSNPEEVQDDPRHHSYNGNINDANFAITQRVWDKIVNNWQRYTNGSSNKLRIHIKRGIPDAYRPAVWQLLLGSDFLMCNSDFDYSETVTKIHHDLVDANISEYCIDHAIITLSKYESVSCTEYDKMSPEKVSRISVMRQIMVDIGRSFPTHQKFMTDTAEGKEGRAELFRVLMVYALYNPSVGYCQGMAFIAGMLLMRLNEEDTFWCIVSLFEKSKYLRGYFDKSLSRIHNNAEVFWRILEQKKPKLWHHLDYMKIHPLMFVTQWFMTLYTGLPCWDTVLCIWDMILFEGTSTVFNVAITIMMLLEEKLLEATTLTDLMPCVLKISPKIVERSKFMPAVWKTILPEWEIKAVQAIIHEDKTDEVTKRKRLESESNDSSQRDKRSRIEETQTGESQVSKATIFQKLASIISGTEDVKKQHARKRNSLTPKRRQSDTRRRKLRPVMIEMKSLNDATVNGSSSPIQNNPLYENQQFRGIKINNEFSFRKQLDKNYLIKSTVSAKKPTIGSTAREKLSFKVFNTPTPLRPTQIKKSARGDATGSSPFTMSPDVEMNDLKNQSIRMKLELEKVD